MSQTAEIRPTDFSSPAGLSTVGMERPAADAMKVVGRTLQEFERTGRDPKDVMIEFRDWLYSVSKNGTPIFVGFNATFDWAFVNYYFQEYVGENPFGFGGIDIKSFYMGMSGCTWNQARSSRIPSKLKGSSPHTHNALDDAIEQGKMFRRMRERAFGKS